MTDDLVKRLLDEARDWVSKSADRMEAADRIEALMAERDQSYQMRWEAADVFYKKLADADYEYNRKTNDLIERHAEQVKSLTAERDRAYASGYSDAETEISTSALGQKNAFLHSQYANAADRIEALTAKCESLGQQLNIAKYSQPDFAWSIHKAAMSDLQAENARLRVALSRIMIVEQGCGGSMSFKEMVESAMRIARAALEGDTRD